MKNPSIASDTEVSEGQIETSVTLVVDATRKATGVALRDLAKRGVLTKRNIECVRSRGNQVVAAITALVKKQFAELAENITGYVKLISGTEVLTLDPTDSNETLAKARDLFTSYLNENVKNHGTNVPSPATGKMDVAVHEIIKNGTFVQIFGDMSDDLNSLCLTQPQIIQFVKKHRKWLRTAGYGTFFLFKVGDEFFVVRVVVDDDDGCLKAYVGRLSNGHVWNAEFRHLVVVPQLKLES